MGCLPFLVVRCPGRPSGPSPLRNWTSRCAGALSHGDLAERLLPQCLLLQAAEPEAASRTPETGQCAEPGQHGWGGP